MITNPSPPPHLRADCLQLGVQVLAEVISLVEEGHLRLEVAPYLTEAGGGGEKVSQGQHRAAGTCDEVRIREERLEWV